MRRHNCTEAALMYLALVLVGVLLVGLCLIPSRYSDGRIPEEVAREMYRAEWDASVFSRDER